MFTCEAYILHALGSFFKHSSLVDISQKIFQHIRTNFESLSTIEPFVNISAYSNHFLISQHIRTCVIYIYAPKHLMPSIFHALSLYMHTHSAHIHARN